MSAMLTYDPDLRIPWGYGEQYVTLRVAWVVMLGEGYDPEYLRRLFRWLTFKKGLIGIGSRSRINQPAKPGVAPEGKSFHQKQLFRDGRLLVQAVDLVAADGPDGNHSHDGVTWSIVARQGSAEAALFGVHCNVDQGAMPEAWHMQAVELDGWQTWVNNGRRNLRINYPIPPLVGDPPIVIPPNPVPPLEDEMNTPAVVSMAPGRVDTFIRGNDGALWHQWRVDGQWSAWESLGGQLASAPAATSAAPGTIDVQVDGTDGNIYTQIWDGTQWSGWVQLAKAP